jgi:serine protease AprX
MYRSLTTIKADLARAEFGITGKGIVWAVIATGVDGRHPHFATHRNLELPHPLRHLDYSNLYERLGEDRHSRDFNLEDNLFDDDYLVREPVDGQGLGTAVAGVIAGEGLDPHSGQTIRGVAPEAKILSVQVFAATVQWVEFNVIAGLKAIQQLNQLSRSPVIHGVVIPLSIGWDVRNYACGHSPVCARSTAS